MCYFSTSLCWLYNNVLVYAFNTLCTCMHPSVCAVRARTGHLSLKLHLFGFLLMLHDIRLCLVVPMGSGEDQVCKDRVSVDAISVRANICMYITLCHFAFMYLGSS